MKINQYQSPFVSFLVHTNRREDPGRYAGKYGVVMVWVSYLCKYLSESYGFCIRIQVLLYSKCLCKKKIQKINIFLFFWWLNFQGRSGMVSRATGVVVV